MLQYFSTTDYGFSGGTFTVLNIFKNVQVTSNSILFKEFDNLFSSLFEDPAPYVELIRIIANHHYGIAQEELIKKSGL